MTAKKDSPAGEISDAKIDELLTALDSESRKQDQECHLPLREPQWTALRAVVAEWFGSTK